MGGQLVIRALGGLKKPRGDEQKQKQQKKQKQQRQLKSSQEAQQQSIPTPKPKPVPQTTPPPPPQLQSSPIAADQQALRNAVSAPHPMSSDDDVSNNKDIDTT